jgi:hypothetical protein
MAIDEFTECRGDVLAVDAGWTAAFTADLDQTVVLIDFDILVVDQAAAPLDR